MYKYTAHLKVEDNAIEVVLDSPVKLKKKEVLMMLHRGIFTAFMSHYEKKIKVTGNKK